MKQQWRQHLKKIREGLSLQRRKEASEHACLELYQSSHHAAFVLSFASFGSEIDLWPLNEKLAAEKRLVLPRLIEKELHLFCVSDLEQLELHSWGLVEPNVAICPTIHFSQIGIGFIPGLGFDLQTKHRLGYGQGYYDRLLASFLSVDTWGVGFLEQTIENLPYNPLDVPLKQIYLY